MIEPVFKDKVQQEHFDKNGYIKITLLSLNDVESLKRLYQHYFPNPSKDFYSSSYENSYALKKEISDAIGEIIVPSLEQIFCNYKWFGSAFLSKGNGEKSEMPMHQDWTIVDESKYVALNIWTPLQNTTEENGTLEVIPGSHKWHNVLRAPTLPFYFNGYQDKLKSKLIPVSTLANEAVVLNQAIIHYSKANKTNETRIAITTGIKSKNAPMIFHYWNNEKPNEIEQFKQEDDFLIRFTDFHKTIFERPTLGESVGTLKFHLKKLDVAEVDKMIRSRATEETQKGKNSFIKRLSRWIKE